MSKIIIRVEDVSAHDYNVIAEFVGEGNTEEVAIRRARRTANIIYSFVDIPIEPGHKIALCDGKLLAMYRVIGDDGSEGP
jgi:hypothetical protein